MTLWPQKAFLTFICILCLSMLVAACASDDSANGDIRPIAPTETARPHATPTFIPLQAQPELPAVDWNNVDLMYSAMRPEHASDVDLVKNKNRYYIEASLRIDPENYSIMGSQRVRYTNNEDHALNEIVFRLYPNFPDAGSHLRVTNFKLAGQAFEPVYEARGTVMTIPLENGLAPGESVEMSMDFLMVHERGLRTDQLGFQDNQIQALNWFPSFSTYEGQERGWWKTYLPANVVDPYYSEIGLYEIKLTHAEDVLVGISGVTVDTTENGDGTVTEHIVTGPMRDNFILASPEMGKITDEIDGIEVNVYFLPGGERAAEWVMETSLRSLEIFNRIFGEYPYRQFDIGESYGNGGGVEYPGIVVVAQISWLNGSPNTEGIVAHEVAHQWWYGMVGSNQSEAPWIDEPLTTYSASLYLREAYNDQEDRYQTSVQGSRDAYNFFLGNGATDLTMNRASFNIPPGHYIFLIQFKGVVFMSDLENLIGREAFLRGVQFYFQQNKYGLSTGYELMHAFEEASGQELDAFFQEAVGDFEGLVLPDSPGAAS